MLYIYPLTFSCAMRDTYNTGRIVSASVEHLVWDGLRILMVCQSSSASAFAGMLWCFISRVFDMACSSLHNSVVSHSGSHFITQRYYDFQEPRAAFVGSFSIFQHCLRRLS